jgi:hypothetical protein
MADPRRCRRKHSRTSGRWADELRRIFGVKWMQIAQDRQEWKRIGEALAVFGIVGIVFISSIPYMLKKEGILPVMTYGC